MSQFPDPDPASPARKRQATRDSMFLQARIERANRRVLTVRVRNLSPGGMMADCADHIEAGERLRIEMRGVGEIGARVAWARDGKIGIAFDEEIDPRLTRRAPGVSAAEEMIVPRPAEHQARRPGFRLG